MPLRSLRLNQLSDATLEWYGRLATASNTRDLETFLSFVCEDCVFQVNDALPIYGKTAFRKAMVHYHETFEKTQHEILNLYGADHHLVAEMLCHYSTNGEDKTVTMPAAAIYDRDENGQLASIRLYVGAGTMFEAFTGAAA